MPASTAAPRAARSRCPPGRNEEFGVMNELRPGIRRLLPAGSGGAGARAWAGAATTRSNAGALGQQAPGRPATTAVPPGRARAQEAPAHGRPAGRRGSGAPVLPAGPTSGSAAGGAGLGGPPRRAPALAGGPASGLGLAVPVGRGAGAGGAAAARGGAGRSSTQRTGRDRRGAADQGRERVQPTSAVGRVSAAAMPIAVKRPGRPAVGRAGAWQAPR